MRKNDSSIFRITPLMDVVKTDPAKFEVFLASVKPRAIPSLAFPSDVAKFYYGEREKKLPPTKAHLHGLVDYLSSAPGWDITHPKPDHLKKITKYIDRIEKKGEKPGPTWELRTQLFNPSDPGQNDARVEAHRYIEKHYSRERGLSGWCVFEGPTSPDVYIDGDDYIIICEGKWTEPHITTTTTYLCAENERRNQMIRHIQAALNVPGRDGKNKKVYAFYIVDATRSYAKELENLKFFAEQVKAETIPIESEDEVQDIINAYCGCITWQQMESAFGIIFKSEE